jgi:hypothetical protein
MAGMHSLRDCIAMQPAQCLLLEGSKELRRGLHQMCDVQRKTNLRSVFYMRE